MTIIGLKRHMYNMFCIILKEELPMNIYNNDMVLYGQSISIKCNVNINTTKIAELLGQLLKITNIFFNIPNKVGLHKPVYVLLSIDCFI
jgi:hypothetical protein